MTSVIFKPTAIASTSATAQPAPTDDLAIANRKVRMQWTIGENSKLYCQWVLEDFEIVGDN